MYVVDPASTKFVFHCPPGKIKPYSIEKGGLAVRTRSDDHHGRRIGQVPKSLLAFAQRNFNPLLLPQGARLPQRQAQREDQADYSPGKPSPFSLRLHLLIRSPGIVQPEIGVLCDQTRQNSVSEHVVDFALDPIGCPRRFKRRSYSGVKLPSRNALDAKSHRGAFLVLLSQQHHSCARFDKARIGPFTGLLYGVFEVRDLHNMRFRKLFPRLFNLKWHLENCDAALKPAIRIRRPIADQQNVATVHPRPGKMYVLSTVRIIDHQWPKVYQPLSESFVGTRPRFNPFQLDSGSFRCFVHGLHRQTGKTVFGANLDWRIALEPDAKRTLGDRRQPSREIPNRENCDARAHGEDQAQFSPSPGN